MKNDAVKQINLINLIAGNSMQSAQLICMLVVYRDRNCY